MKAITILLDQQNKQEWHDLRCVNCGRMFCKVNREISAIVLQAPEGDVIIDNASVGAVETKCRGCECVYSLLIQ